MEYGIVVEGRTRLKVPKEGGISKKEEVFYNPHMALNRDLTIALCRILKPGTFADSMAGSGARGIRVANETDARVSLCDLNPKAAHLIKENAGLNGVDVEVACMDVRRFLAERRFDYVDLDPFGPPVAFIDAAVSAVKYKGTLGVCATDTSALCGSYPKACERKYDATPLRCDCYDEVGLRVFLGFIARCALRHDVGIEPLLAHSTRHYMRAQVRVTGKHAQTMGELGYLQFCFKCMRREYRRLHNLERTCGCGGQLNTAGPLWVGGFAEPKLCHDLSGELLTGDYSRKHDAVALVDAVALEQSLPTPYYDLHKLCKMVGIAVPKMDDLRRLIGSSGYLFARTHFSGTGFRSDMPVESIVSALKEGR